MYVNVNRTKRACAFVSALVLALLYFSVFITAEAADNVRVFDRASILTPDDELLINSRALDAQGKGKIAFMVATTDVKFYGEDFLREHGYNENNDICLLIITVANGKNNYDLYTYGLAKEKISDGEANDILDNKNVYDNIKGGAYADGSLAFIKAASGAVNIPWGTVILVALIIGVVAGAVSCTAVVMKYKMKMRPTNYPLDKYARMKLTGSEDQFIGSHVVVTKVSNSTGGSSGGHGGGSSTGGGSGHRGGR